MVPFDKWLQQYSNSWITSMKIEWKRYGTPCWTILMSKNEVTIIIKFECREMKLFLSFIFGGQNPVSFSSNLTLGLLWKELARGQSSLFALGQPVNGSIAKEFIPLYDYKSTSYHPGLDYCLICWNKSDVFPIEKILYEYGLNFIRWPAAYKLGCPISVH